MKFFRKIDTQAFTERDYEIVCQCDPPGPIVDFLVLTRLRLGHGHPDCSRAIAYIRARNNASELLARADLPEHVRKYLTKYAER